MASEITTTKNCISLVYLCLGMCVLDYSVAGLAMLCERVVIRLTLSMAGRVVIGPAKRFWEAISRKCCV